MSTDEERINTVINYARAQIGKPYSYTANPPSSWDCSKLPSWAYKQIGINLTPYTYTQEKEMVPVPGVTAGSNNNLQRGDLLFFFKNNTHHVSMYIGNGQIIEASSPATGVRLTESWYAWNVTNFSFARRAKGIGVIGSPDPNPGDGGGGDGGDNSNQRVVKTTRSVGKATVSLSSVVGTPQTARFAAINVSNESIFLASDSDVLAGGSNGLLQIVGNTIVAGDQYEVKKIVPGGRNSYEITIDSDFIQSKNQAEAVSSMISRSFEYRYKSIEVALFGNPLVQLGDIVKFNFYTGKVISGQTDFYIITKISHSFDSGLSTNLTLKPLVETVSVV